MKKNGFTLVEVIVVAVIVAIIATTATMLYSGYIRDAAQSTVENMAKTAAASANAYYRKTEEVPTDVYTDLKLHNPDKIRYGITVDGGNSIKVVDNNFENEEITYTARFIPEE